MVIFKKKSKKSRKEREKNGKIGALAVFQRESREIFATVLVWVCVHKVVHTKRVFRSLTLLPPGKTVATARLEKYNIHRKITACKHLILFIKLSSLQASEKHYLHFHFLLSHSLLACFSLCVRENLECTTFSKWDLLRAAPPLDWIPTQIFLFQRTQLCHKWKEAGSPSVWPYWLNPRCGCETGFDEKREQAHLTFLG